MTVLGFSAAALFVIFGGAAAAVTAIIRGAPLYNEHVSFMPHGDETDRMYFWYCRRCDAVGYVRHDVLDGGGFNHTASCPAEPDR